MRLSQIGSTILLCLGFFQLHAQIAVPEQKVETKIDAVKLHLQAAEVHRASDLNIPKGRSLFIFTGLSSKLYPQTIQISAAQAGIRILSVTSKINYLAKSPEDLKIQALRDSVDLIKAELAVLGNEKGAYLAEKEVLKSNRSTKGSDKPLDLELLKAASKYHRERTLEINKELTALQNKIVAANRKLFDHKLQLRELNANKQPTSEIHLVVESAKALSSKVDLRYVVRDCGWAAIYDIESQNFSDKIELRYRALAFNNTAVDWVDVDLTLATADPLKTANQPILATWSIDDYSTNAINDIANINISNEIYIQNNNQEQLNLNGYKQEVQDILGDDYNADIDYETERFREFQRERANKPQLTSATLDVPEFNVDFEIDRPYTIPSDRKPYSIDVETHNLAASYKYYAVPKMDKDAFLLAQVVGWEELNLVSGPVNIYNTNRYVGQSYLNIRNISDTLQISLGRDKDVVVNRIKVKGKSKRQLLGSAKKASVAYEIDVRNNHSKAIDIEILDQIPISTDKEITISLDEKSDAIYTEKTGELLWRFKLEPSTTKKLEMGYSIKYPKDKRVNIQYRKSKRIQQSRYF